MIQIKSRWDDSVIFTSEESTTLLHAVEKAVRDRASLVGASLDRARLDGASLVGASLVGASLDGASLVGASLDRARLDGASLDRARLVGASLVGASLVGASLVGASLDGASLVGASLDRARLDRARLVGARLVGASLDRARLDTIRNDFWDVLIRVHNEVPELRKALIEGRVDGSCYEGECCCLVGTIAKIKHCNYKGIDVLKPNSTRPIECFFMGIKKGDKPETNQISKIVVGWIDEFQGYLGK